MPVFHLASQGHAFSDSLPGDRHGPPQPVGHDANAGTKRWPPPPAAPRTRPLTHSPFSACLASCSRGDWLGCRLSLGVVPDPVWRVQDLWTSRCAQATRPSTIVQQPRKNLPRLCALIVLVCTVSRCEELVSGIPFCELLSLAAQRPFPLSTASHPSEPGPGATLLASGSISRVSL